MKKKEIQSLVADGLLNASSLTLTDDSSAYQFFKFKKTIKKINDDINDDKQNIIETVFGEKWRDCLEEVRKLRSKNDENNELFAKENKAIALLTQLSEEEVQFDKKDFTPIPYSQWRLLQKENERKLFSGYAEILLENVLWKNKS